MKIALVHCPLGHKGFSENLKVIDEEFCLAPPIVLAYVASILEKASHEVIIIDANVLRLSKEQTLRILRDFSPQVIGFRADTYWFHRVVEWAQFFKKALDAKIIVGGINTALYPEESLSYSCFDYGIAGEANKSLPQLISGLEKGDPLSLNNIKGLVYRDNGRIVINPPLDKIVEFDDYPFPARHLLPNERYHSFISQRKNFTIMVTSRGCPYKCIFCAISNIPYQQRAPLNVVDEIEDCYRNHGIREIDIFDPIFFLNKNRSLQIFNEIRKRKLRIEWSCRSRVDVVDDEILKEASAAGCRQIYYGIESASPQILKKLNKKITIEQVEEAIKTSRRYGIRTMGFFMIGVPSETRETMKETIEFSKQLGLDFIQVCRTVAKPSTELNESIKQETGIDYWREYILGKISEERLPARWTDMTEEEIEKGVRKAYYSFYFRPGIILKTILRAESLRELMRYIKVALKMIFLRCP